MKAPKFWYQDKVGLIAKSLLPLSHLWQAGARLKQALQTPYQVPIPVICVGSPMVGGSGKTPTVLMLAKLFKAKGMRADIIMRGYGGKIGTAPYQVKPEDNWDKIGDEAMLYQKAGYQVWLGKDRGKSAELAYQAGAEILLMDDGMQNYSLYKDINICVVDGKIGFGNQQIMPAGPLREPIDTALNQSSLFIIIGTQKYDLSHIYNDKPIFTGEYIPLALNENQALSYLPFSGIAHPDKFLQSLKNIGYRLIEPIEFKDHHSYRLEDEAMLLKAASIAKAQLITTAKDAVKLSSEFKKQIMVFDIELKLNDEDKLWSCLIETLQDHKKFPKNNL